MSLGLCIKPDLKPSPEEAAELNPPFVRSILYQDEDLEKVKSLGRPIWLTVNNEWSRLSTWQNVEESAEWIVANSGGLVWRVSWGNEFDKWWQHNPGDVPPLFAADLVNRAGPILKAGGIETWSTSVVSERWMDYLTEMIPLCRMALDGADFHGYGQAPNGFSEDVPWFFGRLRDAIAWIQALGVRAGGSEYGVTVSDAGGLVQQADWVQCAHETAMALGIDLAYFSYHNKIGTILERGDRGHGLLDDDGERRPAFARYAALPVVGVPSIPPVVVVPPPVVVGEVAPNPWRFWSAERLAEVLGAPVENIYTFWPKVNEQLWHVGIEDQAPLAAAAANIRIETGGPDWTVRFTPVREAYWLSEAWRAANLRYYPDYGRGLMQCTWPDNYEYYGLEIDKLWNAQGAIIQMIRENRDAMLDGDVSACFVAVYFRDHGGYMAIPEAARRGDMTEVRRLIQGGSAGLGDLWTYWNSLMPADVVPLPLPVDQLGYETAVALFRSRVGDPYVFGGKEPGAFDCSGAYYWATEGAGVKWPSPIWLMNTDAIYEACEPLDGRLPTAGDAIFYEYHDPNQEGIRFPHMGMWLSEGITIEARWPNGVAEYIQLDKPFEIRRAPGVDATSPGPVASTDPRAKFISFAGYLGGDVAERLALNASRIPVPALPKPKGKMTKAEWRERAEVLEAEIHAHYAEDQAIKDEIIRAAKEVLA